MAALNDQHRAIKAKMSKLKEDRKVFQEEFERRKTLQTESTQSISYLVDMTDEEITALEVQYESLEKRQLEPKSAIVTGPVISFHDLTYSVNVRKGTCCRHKIEKVVLNNISGLLLPGMNALMGPTGCGKTSLLDILAGRKDMSKVRGTILVNGYKQPNYFKCMTGYVVQDDVLLGTLTVRESIMFSANLRLPSDVSAVDKRSRVDKVISDLGLTKCADSKVGTEFIRGVSGGERKRTCIGMELIVSPSILFLDEPTTGLDASTANNVMSLLHKQGLTIIFSIHQPRYGIFKKFDGLILLASGEIIYHGPAASALDFFQHQTKTNLGAEIEITDQENLETRRANVIMLLSNKYKETFWFKKIQRTLDRKLKMYKNNPKTVTETAKYATSVGVQMLHVSKRSLVNVFRNPASSLSQILMTLFFAVSVSVLFYDLGYSYPEAIQNRAGAFFFVVMISLFGNMSAVEIFIRERVIFIHEMHSGFYRVSVFFFSKIFCDLIPLRIFPMFLFAVTTYYAMGLSRGADKFGIYFFTLFMTTLAAAILTFAISAGVSVLALANIYVGLVYTMMMLFGGLLVNLNTMSKYIKWMEFLSVVRYSVKALSINEMKDAKFYIYGPNKTVERNMSTAGNEFLTSQGISYETDWDLWQNHVALGVISIALTLLCYIELRIIVQIK